MTTTLGTKMRERADAEALRADHALRTLADAFDAAAAGFYAEHQAVTVQRFVGAWARARKAWCSHTGESLL